LLGVDDAFADLRNLSGGTVELLTLDEHSAGTKVLPDKVHHDGQFRFAREKCAEAAGEDVLLNVDDLAGQKRVGVLRVGELVRCASFNALADGFL